MRTAKLFVFCAVAYSLPPGRVAHSANYHNCFHAEVHTVDSGGTSWQGTAEDYWTNCDSLGSCNAILRRARILVDRPGSESTLTLYTDEDTGCVDWSSAFTGSLFSISVETASSNIGGTTDILVHDDPSYFGTSSDTYITTFQNANPQTQNWYVGNNGGTWTTFAALGFSAYRWGDYLPSGIKVYAAMDESDNCSSSAHWSDSFDFLTSGRHYIKVAHADTDCGLNHSKSKFVIAHEAGHAFAALSYGDRPGASNGQEPNVLNDHAVTPNACGFGNSYGIDTKEWNSLGFREGFAHFVAARVWNNKSANGYFGWMGDHYDLDWYEAGTDWGGRLENVCCTSSSSCSSSWTSAGTNEDWLRFFWDLYNSTAFCPNDPAPQPDIMLDLYSQTRLNGGLSSTNYYSRMYAASFDIAPYNCFDNAVDSFAAVNGISN